MYQVFRNKRVQLKGEMFFSFEQARQALRRKMRKQFEKQHYNESGKGLWDNTSRNPSSYTSLGFAIKKVA